MTETTWTATTIALSKLKPWERNPKRISKAHAARLLDLWERLGQFQTIAIGPAGEVYDGHQRLSVLKAKHGGGYVVQVLQASRPLTEAEREELTIAAHSGTTGSWDWDALAGWDVDNLTAWGLDEELLKDWNAGATALREMLAAETAATGEDPGPQVDKASELQAKWGTATGQLWQLGEHRLICGDCADAAVVARVMGGEKAGCCVTDPPYGINREGITNDDPEGLRALFDGCLAAMPIDDGVLIAFQSPRLEWVWLDATRAAGWHPERLLWMYKPNDETFPWRGWLLKSEAIRASSKGKAEWLDVHPYSHDCYSPTTLGQELSDTEGWHASVKPQAVVIDLVKRVGGIVYDPFLGSGTTMVAAHRLGRRCFGIEIDPGYCAVTLERMSGLGVTPILVE